MHRITVIGGGLAGLTAAVTAAEEGSRCIGEEAHSPRGGEVRTAKGPYRTNDGPHALYCCAPGSRRRPSTSTS
jgi:succinate dehydrogenase/fumarate reductase flavoprotein subunit